LPPGWWHLIYFGSCLRLPSTPASGGLTATH